MSTLFYPIQPLRSTVSPIYTLLLLSVLFISGCSTIPPIDKKEPVIAAPVCPVCKPTVCPKIAKPIKKVAKKTRGELNLPVIGGVENVVVEPHNLEFEARIDTGAKSTSIHAENIQLIEREGKRFVRFSLYDNKTKSLVELERPFRRRVSIKQQDGNNETRYVVTLWLTLGKNKDEVEVSLTNRSAFDYELLVGRNLLTDRAIVDVSLRHTLRH